MIRTLTVLSLLALPIAGSAQGKLDEVREAVDRPSTSDSSTRDSSSNGTPTGDDSFWSLLFSGGDGDDPEEPTATFGRYPYSEPGTAYLWLDRPDGNWLSARTAVEVGSNFDGLNRTGFKLFLDTTPRLGLKSDWDYYSERVAGGRDTFWLADITPTYRLIQAENFQLHLGLGLRLLLDHGRDRGGWNLLAGFDLFPSRPVHAFGSAEVGTLGNAGLYRFRGGVGVNWRMLEGYAGYDYVRIGGVDLQGPFVGLRVWY